MLAALAYVLAENADHYFSMTENAETVKDDISRLPTFDTQEMEHPQAAGICGTLAEFAAQDDSTDTTVCGVTVDSEMHYGSILAHYTRSGDIVRFVAIKAY